MNVSIWNTFDRPVEEDITADEVVAFSLLSDTAVALGYLTPSLSRLTPKGESIIDTWINDPEFPLPDGYQGTDEEHIAMILMMVASGEGDPNG